MANSVTLDDTHLELKSARINACVGLKLISRSIDPDRQL